MKNDSIFTFKDYRAYLERRLPTTGEDRGIRSKLASTLRIQTAFVSRVLHGDGNFSLEHGLEINKFLGHTDSESEYFLLLLQHARAGSKALEKHFEEKIRKMQEARTFIAEQVKAKQILTLENQLRYYSTWYYAAIHMLLLVPSMRNVQALSEHLQLERAQVSKILDFLVSCGLATHSAGEYLPGKAKIHLSQDSDLVSKHHANWRMQAIRAADQSQAGNVCWSNVICISEADAEKIRADLIHILESYEPTILASKEEAVFCFNVDFFRV